MLSGVALSSKKNKLSVNPKANRTVPFDARKQWFSKELGADQMENKRFSELRVRHWRTLLK